jgi:hypothetical protein
LRPFFGFGFGGLMISEEGGLELLDESFWARANASRKASICAVERIRWCPALPY